MAPVYEGKMGFENVLFFLYFPFCAGLCHRAYCISWDTIELRLIRRQRCVAP